MTLGFTDSKATNKTLAVQTSRKRVIWSRNRQMEWSCGDLGRLMSEIHPPPQVKQLIRARPVQCWLIWGSLTQVTITHVQPIRQMVGARSQGQRSAFFKDGGWVLEHKKEVVERWVISCSGCAGSNTQPPWSSRGSLSLFPCQNRDTSHLISWRRRWESLSGCERLGRGAPSAVSLPGDSLQCDSYVYALCI